MLARTAIVALFWDTTHLFSLREVSDVLHSGPLEIDYHAGIPEGHSPHWSGHVSMYVTPVASSWTMQVAYIVTSVSPINVSGCLVSGGPQQELKMVKPSAGRPKPPWSLEAMQSPVWAGGTLVTTLNQTSPVWPTCIPQLISTRPSSFLHSNCSVATSACWESERSTQWESLARWDAAPPSSQGSCSVELPNFLSSHAAQGKYLASQLACWPWPSEWPVPQWVPLWGHLFCRHLCRGQLFSGLSYLLWSGGTPDSGTWVPSSSLVIGATRISTGMGAQGHPSGNLY